MDLYFLNIAKKITYFKYFINQIKWRNIKKNKNENGSNNVGISL